MSDSPALFSAPDIQIKGLPSGYEVEHLARVFFPEAGLRTTHSTKGTLLYTRAGKGRLAAGCRLGGRCVVRLAPLPQGETSVKRALSRLLYDLLREVTGLRPPWGMLTGVRPIRLTRNTLAAGGEAGAEQVLRDGYDVSGEKYRLAREIVGRQAPLLAASPPHSYNLYLSIPFCPSRCSYCSFVSQTIGRELGLIDEYLTCLEEELAATASAAAEAGLVLETIYIGGGTPTSLDARQLERLLRAVATHFDTGTAREYTVEAGRPDCTDAEKLRILKAHGVTRISINPQSFSQSVLRAIGRAHTAADILRCYEDARRAGHDFINMDLIAGLPGDDAAGFAASLSQALSLVPENITLHTLTLKRGTDLTQQGEARREGSGAGEMLAEAYPRLAGAGYGPYYLYRQKSTVENLENTGWALPAREGLYNILMMEETRPVLAAGAGACTKLVAGEGRFIKRLYNHKYPGDYIGNFPSVIAKKKGVAAFYARYLDPQTSG